MGVLFGRITPVAAGRRQEFRSGSWSGTAAGPLPLVASPGSRERFQPCFDPKVPKSKGHSSSPRSVPEPGLQTNRSRPYLQSYDDRHHNTAIPDPPG